MPSFGAITLVQSVLGGSASAVVPANTTLTTSAASFGSPTTAGNLVVCLVWATQQGTFGFGAVTPPDFGVGFTWSSLPAATFSNFTPLAGGLAGLFYRENAPSISSPAVVSANSGSSGGSFLFSVEFSLFEFSGVLSSFPLDVSATPNGTSSTPGATITTHDTDLVITSAIVLNSGSALAPGTGFTLGPTAIVATIGQSQYATNVPSGSVDARFIGTEPRWATAVAAFLPAASPPPSGVARHKGYVF